MVLTVLYVPGLLDSETRNHVPEPMYLDPESRKRRPQQRPPPTHTNAAHVPDNGYVIPENGDRMPESRDNPLPQTQVLTVLWDQAKSSSNPAPATLQSCSRNPSLETRHPKP